jgi:hypothetical protein
MKGIHDPHFEKYSIHDWTAKKSNRNKAKSKEQNIMCEIVHFTRLNIENRCKRSIKFGEENLQGTTTN